MPGPQPKPPERRQRRNKTASIVPFPTGRPTQAPPVPDGLLASTKASWKTYWDSALAGAATDSDHSAIRRLFTLYDERERAYRAYRRERLITGSQGQMVINPMGRAMHEFDAEIRQMEDRLGLSPRARLQLGITLGAAAQSMADLNQILSEDADSGTDERDPRQFSA